MKQKLLKELGENMTPSESAVAILVESADWPVAVERMEAHGFRARSSSPRSSRRTRKRSTSCSPTREGRIRSGRPRDRRGGGGSGSAADIDPDETVVVAAAAAATGGYGIAGVEGISDAKAKALAATGI